MSTDECAEVCVVTTGQECSDRLKTPLRHPWSAIGSTCPKLSFTKIVAEFAKKGSYLFFDRFG
jgi:hypothetical protein